MHAGPTTGCPSHRGCHSVAFKAAARKTMVCANTRAGQGRTLGYASSIFPRESHTLPRISTGLASALDTCHLGRRATTSTNGGGLSRQPSNFIRSDRRHRAVGRSFTANDSNGPCGIRVDRPEHIVTRIGRERSQATARPRFRAADPIETGETHCAEQKGAIVADPLELQNLEDAETTTDCV